MVYVGDTFCQWKPVAEKHRAGHREAIRNMVSLLLFSALQKARPLPS